MTAETLGAARVPRAANTRGRVNFSTADSSTWRWFPSAGEHARSCCSTFVCVCAADGVRWRLRSDLSRCLWTLWSCDRQLSDVVLRGRSLMFLYVDVPRRSRSRMIQVGILSDSDDSVDGVNCLFWLPSNSRSWPVTHNPPCVVSAGLWRITDLLGGLQRDAAGPVVVSYRREKPTLAGVSTWRRSRRGCTEVKFTVL